MRENSSTRLHLAPLSQEYLSLKEEYLNLIQEKCRWLKRVKETSPAQYYIKEGWRLYHEASTEAERRDALSLIDANQPPDIPDCIAGRIIGRKIR